MSGYNVHITDTTTAETRIYRYDSAWDEWSDFMWEEGNFGCDCNRGLFFASAIGADDPDRECGTERYHVRVTDDEGKELYSDDTPREQLK